MRALTLFFLFSCLTFGASIRFSPSFKAIDKPGVIFEVSVVISDVAPGDRIAGAALDISFDPGVVQVTDQTGNPVTQLTPLYPFVLPDIGGGLINQVDNTAGFISYDNGTQFPEGAPAIFVKFFVTTVGLGRAFLKFGRNTEILIDKSGTTLVQVKPSMTNMEITVGDVTPPEIFNVLTRQISNTTATISFDTDEPAFAVVEYGVTGESEFLFRTAKTGLSQHHEIELMNLTPATNYTFRIVAEDETGNKKTSISYAVTTTDKDTAPPVISHTAIQQAVPGQKLFFQAEVSDNVQVKKVILFYRETGSSSFQQKEMVLDGGTFQTDLLFPSAGLDYYISAEDTSSNVSTLPGSAPKALIAVQAASLTGTLEGQVTEKGTREPLKDVIVKALEGGKKALTDAAGRFSLTLAPGSFTVVWEKQGFITLKQNVTIEQDQTNTIDIVLERGATLQGQLLNTTGNKPVVSAQVRLLRESQLIASELSDTKGSYKLENVPGGEYTVEIDAPGFVVHEEQGSKISITLTSGEQKTVDFFLDPLPAKKLVVFPSFKGLGGGESFQFQARAITEDGFIMVGFPVIWQLSPLFIGEMDQKGNFKASSVDATGFVFATLEKGTLLPNGATQPEALRSSAQLSIRKKFEFVSISAGNAPFSPKKNELGRISYRLSQDPDRVEIWIYALNGRLLRKLEGQPVAEGRALWDGRDELGRIVSNGIYAYQIISFKEGKAITSDVRLIAVFQ